MRRHSLPQLGEQVTPSPRTAPGTGEAGHVSLFAKHALLVQHGDSRLVHP